MVTCGEGGGGGREREEGLGLPAPAIQGNTLYHSNLRRIANSSSSAVNTEPQPEDSSHSEAVSLRV